MKYYLGCLMVNFELRLVLRTLNLLQGSLPVCYMILHLLELSCVCFMCLYFVDVWGEDPVSNRDSWPISSCWCILLVISVCAWGRVRLIQARTASRGETRNKILRYLFCPEPFWGVRCVLPWLCSEGSLIAVDKNGSPRQCPPCALVCPCRSCKNIREQWLLCAGFISWCQH